MKSITDKANERIARQETKARLKELENVIEQNMDSFIKCAEAVIEIRESKLYRFDYKTWDEYCNAQWELTGRAINYRVAKALPKPSPELPTSEVVRREMDFPSPDKKGGQSKNDPKTKLASQADAADEEEPEEDETIEGRIKEHNHALESWCRQLMKMVETLPNGPWSNHLNCRDSAIQSMKDACGYVRTAKCVMVCPKCSGDGCRICLDTGMITNHRKGELG
jgi:hypothetical protein